MLSVLLLAKLLFQGLIPGDLFLLWRNIKWDMPGPAQALRFVQTLPRKGRATAVDSLFAVI